MRKLPNGIMVFNATPHPITFWDEGWEEPVVVEPDERIDASIEEEIVEVRDIPPNLPSTAPFVDLIQGTTRITFVRPRFVGTPEGERIAREALEEGANVVVGSIIAAQAYPGLVVAMTPAPGYERKPPTEKRMRPDKFTVFFRER
jgi:hypothetical protein